MSWEAEVKELGDVCSFQRGLTYAKGDEVDISENVVLRANNISMATNSLDFTELKYIKDSIAIPESKLVRRDTLMICTASGSKSHLGKVAYVDNDYGYAFGGFMGLLVPEREIAGRYLYYNLLSDQYKEFIEGLSDGVNINNLKWDDLKSFTLSVPPLPEQQRIVGKLDAAFAALAEAQAHVERNRANARELFESYLNGVFEGKEEWITRPLHEFIHVKHGFAFLGEHFTSVGEHVLLTMGNFFEKGGYRDRGVKQKHYSGPIPEDFVLSEGDLVVAMTEQAAGLLGAPLLVPESGKYLHNQRIGLVQQPSGQVVSNEFLFHIFNSKAFRDAVHASGSGVKVRHTSPTKIGEVNVSYPASLKEQKGIIDRLAELEQETLQLETTYQQKLTELAGLKKAVLGTAFRGEL